MTIPTGIHRFQTRPIAVEAGEWRPNDPFQRGAVLGWLTGHNVPWRVQNPTEANDLATDWLHILDADGNVFDAAGPGDVVVFDREYREVVTFGYGEFDQRFEHPQPHIDPHQPSLLDLLDGLATTLVIKQ